MKKLISVFLALTLMLSLVVPAAAAYYPGQETPIIIIRGDGRDIVDADGNVIWPISLGEGDEGKDKILEAAKNILFPHFINGILFDQWDGYCDVVYDELSPLFEKTQLDKNGEASNGSGLSAADIEHNAYFAKFNAATWQNGCFDVSDYTYYYDWRLSPMEVIDDFHAYITTVMKSTGASQVSLVGRCLGASFLMAYIQKYGSLGHIKSIVFDSGVVNGTSLLTDAYQGKITADDKALERFINDYINYHRKPEPDETGAIDEVMLMVNELISTSVALLNETGVTTVATDMIMNIYKKVYTNLVPRLLVKIFATWPGYWTGIATEDFDACLDFVFGEEGTETRTEYAGLIEKLNWYNDTVASKIPQIISDRQSEGKNVAAIAKYGYQLYPFVESHDEIADGLVELKSASFGATTSKVNETLSNDYINERIDLGFADYISNDKAVDASTSLLKNTVWIIKGIEHNIWSDSVDSLIHDICQGTVTSVYDSADYPQFMVYNDSADIIVPMTDENCNVSNWEEITTEKPTLWSRLKALFKWLYAMFRYLFRISKDNTEQA
ncbi:MAG: esterase/lipase family protein [Acutalibacteraceae bacterium]